MPNLRDELVSNVINVELVKVFKEGSRYNETLTKEECRKLLEKYRYVSKEDFKAFYMLGDYLWAILCSLDFKYNGQRFDELTEFLLNFGPDNFTVDQRRRRFLGPGNGVGNMCCTL